MGALSAVDEVKMRTVPLSRSVNPYRKKRPMRENIFLYRAPLLTIDY